MDCSSSAQCRMGALRCAAAEAFEDATAHCSGSSYKIWQRVDHASVRTLPRADGWPYEASTRPPAVRPVSHLGQRLGGPSHALARLLLARRTRARRCTRLTSMQCARAPPWPRAVAARRACSRGGRCVARWRSGELWAVRLQYHALSNVNAWSLSLCARLFAGCGAPGPGLPVRLGVLRDTRKRSSTASSRCAACGGANAAPSVHNRVAPYRGIRVSRRCLRSAMTKRWNASAFRPAVARGVGAALRNGERAAIAVAWRRSTDASQPPSLHSRRRSYRTNTANCVARTKRGS